jgi:phosphatidylglycerophosphatase A
VTRRDPRTIGAVLVATLCGAGRSPIVPGTVGTLAAMPLAIAAQRLLPAWGFLAAAACLALLGVWASGVAARVMALHDPRAVVIDEAAGLFVTLLFQPAGTRTLVLGFVLFRAMDIIKPPPARRAERLPGGWGIVTDDLIAGVYANLALRLLTFLSLRPA